MYPSSFSARGNDINEFPDFRTIRPMIRATLKRAAGTIGVCDPLRHAMIQLGADPAHSVTIGNGIDSTRFWPMPMLEARKALGLEQGRIVVSVGGLIPRKRHSATISAIGRLAQQGFPASLYIIGEGPSRLELQSLIERVGLRRHVTLVGTVPNDRLRFWYSAADVSCLASSREGWANVLLESMACGTPVVATRIWGTPDVVTEDHLGLLCDLDDDSLTAGLAAALTRQWDRQRIATFARSRTWDVVAEELQRFLQSLVTQKSHTRNVLMAGQA
jgi:glycosyltransferase involved in cell wall biosynthesis